MQEHAWRERACELFIAFFLALACAVLLDQAMRALAAPAPCESEAVAHRLVIEPTPHPRCLTFHAEVAA